MPLARHWPIGKAKAIRRSDGARLSTVPVNIVADFGGTAAGMVSATAPNQEGTVELISMWVAPFARGSGVGDSLVTAVVECARGQRAARIALAVFKSNERAVALYTRHGFVDVGASDGTGSGIASVPSAFGSGQGRFAVCYSPTR